MSDIENDCLICYEPNPTQKLCKKCKFLYCNICSKKINYRCSICCRKDDKDYYYYDEIYYLNGTPSHISCLITTFVFLCMIAFYVIVFTLYSYYHFINYSEIYHFFILIKQNSIEKNLINDCINIIDNIDYTNITNISNISKISNISNIKYCKEIFS